MAETDWDYLEATYQLEGGVVRLVVADEVPGPGTRSGGHLLRTKVENILRADAHARIVLDWTGLPSVSSSFADEVVGKLFVALGPVAFNVRVAIAGAEPLVRGLIDRAVMQRAAHAG